MSSALRPSGYVPTKGHDAAVLLLRQIVEASRVGYGGAPVMRSKRVNYTAGLFHQAVALLSDARDPLTDAREAFLNMVADAKKWEFETDGEYDDEGRASCCSTVTMVSDHSQVQELCDALGMVGPYDEFIEDRIARYVEIPPSRVAAQSTTEPVGIPEGDEP